MTLVDTSVWIDHSLRTVTRMSHLVEAGEVVTHPSVIAEIALDSLPRRPRHGSDVAKPPSRIEVPTNAGVTATDPLRVYARRTGDDGADLICAVMQGESVILWTGDERLRSVVGELGSGTKTMGAVSNE